MKTLFWVLFMLAGPGVFGQSLYDFSAQDIDDNPTPLSQYKGKVTLIVNTARRCGFTGQYEGLEKLYQKYKSKGFEILAFPTNDFFGQEPGSNESIKEFCTGKYKTTFPLFAKITVRGDQTLPLYKWLTSNATGKKTAGEITWNFNKFLLDREGKVLARFPSETEPLSPALVKALDQALGL